MSPTSVTEVGVRHDQACRPESCNRSFTISLRQHFLLYLQHSRFQARADTTILVPCTSGSNSHSATRTISTGGLVQSCSPPHVSAHCVCARGRAAALAVTGFDPRFRTLTSLAYNRIVAALRSRGLRRTPRRAAHSCRIQRAHAGHSHDCYPPRQYATPQHPTTHPLPMHNIPHRPSTTSADRTTHHTRIRRHTPPPTSPQQHHPRHTNHHANARIPMQS